MTRHLTLAVLTALAAALACTLVALAAQASEISELKSLSAPFEYRAEVAPADRIRHPLQLLDGHLALHELVSPVRGSVARRIAGCQPHCPWWSAVQRAGQARVGTAGAS